MNKKIVKGIVPPRHSYGTIPLKQSFRSCAIAIISLERDTGEKILNNRKVKKIWEPLPHHTVVHNVTQARPGWSVAPANAQGRK